MAAKKTAPKAETKTEQPKAKPEKPSPKKTGLKKEQAKEYKPESKLEDTGKVLYRVKLDRPKIAGVDSEWDITNPLCDIRIFDADFITETRVQSLAEYGQETPGECIVRDGTLWVNKGKHRLANLRVAEERYPDREFWFYFFVDDESKTDKEVFARARRDNAEGTRKNDTGLNRAENCARAQAQYGYTVAEYAALEGISPDTMQSELALLRLDPEYRALVKTDTLAKITAIHLAKCGDFETQRAVYERAARSMGGVTLESIRSAKLALQNEAEAKERAAREARIDEAHATGTTNKAAEAVETMRAHGMTVDQGALNNAVQALFGPSAVAPSAQSPAPSEPVPAALASLFASAATNPESQPGGTVNDHASNAPAKKVAVALSITEVRRLRSLAAEGKVRLTSEAFDVLSIITGDLPAEHVKGFDEGLKLIRG